MLRIPCRLRSRWTWVYLPLTLEMRLLAPRTEPVSPLHVGTLLVAIITVAWTTTAYARAPYSIAVIIMGALCLVRLNWQAVPIRWWRGAPEAAWAYFRRLDYSLLAALPVAYAVSLLYAGDLELPGRFLRVALPMLGASGAFYVMRKPLKRFIPLLWLAFLVFAAVAAFAALVYVLHNHEALIVALGKGRAVPLPLAHVRAATMLAFASLVGVYVLSSSAFAQNITRRATNLIKIVALIATSLCIVAVHLIAVRTGLILLYIGLLMYGFRWLLQRYTIWRATVGVVALVLVLGSIAWQVPTVQRKIDYTLYDLSQIGKPSASSYSDGARYESFRAAWHIISAAPLLGAHQKGMDEEMNAAYARMGQEQVLFLPTNQFLFSWVLAGLPGLLGVILFFVGPMLEAGWWRRPLLLEFLVMIAALCLVETPFASDVGVGLSILMVCLAKHDISLDDSFPHKVV